MQENDIMTWKNEIMFHVENETKNLKQKEKPEKTKPILQGCHEIP